MRISKEPEERKQEILETAIKLFSVNGFEKTSISDIAKEIGIAQGLCYRYFPSKDVLFQSAINEYSNILVANMTKNTNTPHIIIFSRISFPSVLPENAPTANENVIIAKSIN